MQNIQEELERYKRIKYNMEGDIEKYRIEIDLLKTENEMLKRKIDLETHMLSEIDLYKLEISDLNTEISWLENYIKELERKVKSSK